MKYLLIGYKGLIEEEHTVNFLFFNFFKYFWWYCRNIFTCTSDIYKVKTI